MKNGEVGQYDVRHEFAVEFERSTAGKLFRPEQKPVIVGERNLPQASLKPHPPDQDARRPQPQIRTCALLGVLPPIDDEQDHARRKQDVKQKEKNEPG
jgi:hypothetical protein